MLKDKDGEIINVGGGIFPESNGRTLIKGTVEWETTDEGSFALYHGKRIKHTPDKPLASTGTASTARTADWDGDGDMDLIVGNADGQVHWLPNEGTVTQYAFGKPIHLKAANRPLQVKSRRAGPFVVDWDQDDDLDLLVGAEDGSVSFYENKGTRRSPKLAAAKQVVPPGKVGYGASAPKDVQRGQRAKICVADWNGDGRLDLLVGDMTTQKPDVPEPTAAEKAKHDGIRKELEPVQRRYSELINKIMGESRVRDEKEQERIHKELTEVSTKMQALRKELPVEYETHGWVWLFLRKP